MSWRKIKIDIADKEFSIFIRLRDGMCVRCFKPGEADAKGRMIVGLDNSHFWGRGKESTRFDPLNCDALCRKCHEYFGGNPGDYAAWKENRLGSQEYKKLMVRAMTYQQRDRKMSLLYARQLLKELK